MIRWLVGSSIRFRGLVVALAGLLIGVGVMQLRETPVDVLPEFSPPTVEVQTEALGLSAQEVEQLITVPMEQDLLNGIAFLRDIRSQSVPGLSRILLEFEPGTDIFLARQGVAERLAQAHALPQVSKPPQMLQPVSSTNRVLMVGVSSKSLSAIRLSVLARWTLVPRLMGVPGVANVSIWGQRDRQLQVQVDPERLRDAGVSLSQVLETTGNALWFSPLTFVEASTPGTGGFIDTASQRLGIQHFSPITTADSLAKVPLETQGRPLALGDVASVVEDHQPLIGDAIVDGGRGLMLVVEKFPQANVLDVTRGVEEAIDAMRPGLAGVDFDTGVYRPASSIEKDIDNVRLALILGAALLVVALAAFFFNWRTALVALVAITLSIIAAALVLQALGEGMNALVLAGLAGGLLIVVDDAVVSVDAVAHRLRVQGAEARPSVMEATLAVRTPLVYATLVVALATLPLFFLRGAWRAFFPDIAVAFLLTVAAAMTVALTVTPALAALLVAKTGPPRDARFVRWLRDRYASSLARVIRKPRLAYLAFGLVVTAGIATAPFLHQSHLPTFKESDLLIRWDGPPGTSLPEMNRITALASSELRSLDGVAGVGAHVGRAVTADQIVGANSAEIWLALDPDADYDATLASVKDVVAGYPGLSREVASYTSARVDEVLPGSDDIVVRLYGEDLSALANKATEVRQTIAGIDGLGAERVRLPTLEPTLQIEVDLAAAERYGVKPGDVRRAAATLLSGIVAGSLFEQQKVFDVVVWGTPQTRSSLSSIRDLLIDAPRGGHVRLGQVADVSIVPSPTAIQRQAVSRYIDVTASVNGRAPVAVAADIRSALAKIQFPLESHAEVIVSHGQPRGRLVGLAFAAAIGMLVLLQALFASWRLAALTLLTLPVAVSGGLVAALADGGTLSFGSYLGLLVVFALAMRNGILLVNRYQELGEHDAFAPAVVLRGTQERLLPVITTAVAAALLVLPLIVGGSQAGYEVIHPLAVVILGGLVTSTLVVLFLLPALYRRFGGPREPGASALRPDRFVEVFQRRAAALIRRERKTKEPSAADADSEVATRNHDAGR